MRRRHSDVDEDEIGLVLANERNELATVTRLADDLETRMVKQACQPFSKKNVVIGDDDAGSPIVTLRFDRRLRTGHRISIRHLVALASARLRASPQSVWALALKPQLPGSAILRG